MDNTAAVAAADAVPAPWPAAEQRARLAARVARLDVAARAERSRLGAQCGDMSAATINDTSLRLARMEAVQEELGYAVGRLDDGASLQQVLNRAVVALAGAAGPLGGSSTEVQRARAAALAEVVHILQDEMRNPLANSASGR